MAKEVTYHVTRQHIGDKLYMPGDERTADEQTVKHLVLKGVLVAKTKSASTPEAEPKTKAAAKPKTKAAAAPENKAEQEPDNKADADPEQKPGDDAPEQKADGHAGDA